MRIKFKNKTSKEIYLKNKDVVYELSCKYSKYLDFNLNLKVIFKSKDANNLVNARVKKKSKWFYLKIYDVAFSYENEYLESIIFHEFAHIYDYYHVTLNYKDIDVIKTPLDAKIDLGYTFWTEFFAFYKCFYYRYSNPNESYTLLELVSKYQKISKKTEIIMKMIVNEEKKTQEIDSKICDVLNLLKEFTYEVARYIAAFSFKRKYDYSEKHKNKKAFNEVNTIINDLAFLVEKMTHGTYGRYMVRRLEKIGDYISREIFSRFNLQFDSYKGKTAFTYEFDMEA